MKVSGVVEREKVKVLKDLRMEFQFSTAISSETDLMEKAFT